MQVTHIQRQAIGRFIEQLDGHYNMEQWLAAGEFWAKDSTVWRHIQQPGTGQLRLVCWYNYTHRPGANEWRPAIIIQAVLAHLNHPYNGKPTTASQPVLVG